MNPLNKQLTGTIVFFSVMAIVALLYYTGINSLVKTNDWVAHTHRVISFGNLIQKLLVDMETGERGFLITGKNNFLDPYQKGHEEYLVVMSHTKNLVSDNPAQIKALEAIDTLVHKWLETAATPEINTRLEVNKGTASPDAISILIEKETGKSVMDELRVLLRKFNKVEEQLLIQRRKESKKAAQRTIYSSIIGTLLATIIGYFYARSASQRTASSIKRTTHNLWKDKTDELLKLEVAEEQALNLKNDAHHAILAAVIILLLLIGSPLLFISNPLFENHDTTTGEEYGFEIGKSKLIAYNQASLLQSAGGIYGIRVGDDKMFSKIFTDLSQNNYLILKHYDEWHIEYNAKRVGMNTVHLLFMNDNLNKISKHYQAIILPDFLQNIFAPDNN